MDPRAVLEKEKNCFVYRALKPGPFSLYSGPHTDNAILCAQIPPLFYVLKSRRYSMCSNPAAILSAQIPPLSYVLKSRTIEQQKLL
jgi:hypothetical protein